MKIVKKSTYELHVEKTKKEAREEVIEYLREQWKLANSYDDFYSILFDCALADKKSIYHHKECGNF